MMTEQNEAILPPNERFPQKISLRLASGLGFGRGQMLVRVNRFDREAPLIVEEMFLPFSTHDSFVNKDTGERITRLTKPFKARDISFTPDPKALNQGYAYGILDVAVDTVGTPACRLRYVDDVHDEQQALVEKARNKGLGRIEAEMTRLGEEMAQIDDYQVEDIARLQVQMARLEGRRFKAASQTPQDGQAQERAQLEWSQRYPAVYVYNWHPFNLDRLQLTEEQRMRLLVLTGLMAKKKLRKYQWYTRTHQASDRFRNGLDNSSLKILNGLTPHQKHKRGRRFTHKEAA